MFRASGSGPDGPLVVAGLTDGNVMRLKAGQPIVADFRSFGADLPGRLLIFHGNTEADIEAMLRKNALVNDDTRRSVDPRIGQESAIRSRHARVLIATVGLPKAGKTTWAKQQAYPVVNPDSIRLAIHGQRFVAEAERFVWATAHAMVRSLFFAGHDTVILDATNTTRKRRDEWQSQEWGTYFRVFDTSAEVCLQRAADARDATIVPVIERMRDQWEPLNELELIWPS